MAVAFDAASESHGTGTGSTGEASYTWNHSGGTPQGVLVFTTNDDDIESEMQSVTYGGVTVPAVSGGYAQISSGETGGVKAWFLGSGVPTGTQAVVVNRANNASNMYAICFTVTASGNTEVYTAGIVLTQSTSSTLAEQNVSDGSPGTNSLRFAGLYSGLTAPPAAGANSTLVGGGIDQGQNSCAGARENTAGQGSRPVGFSSGTADDVVAVYLAVREVIAATPIRPRNHGYIVGI